ncbi:MAG: bifunctional oligoribonuclease/PAP phosphatase NrnA [Verrucomicrobia bacterium]|nr:bifunctional oligoribonuclease/PAP phosphatase NrnA [Verrucomicrobiota bacterium]
MKPARPAQRILNGIRNARRLCVVGHVRPDGDCVGSQIGLALALRNQGKDVTCWNEDPIPGKLAFLDPDGILQRPKPGRAFDAVIATDSATLERLGTVAALIRNRRLFVNIDHHAGNTRYADLNWIQPRAPSTAELVYALLKTARWPVTPPIADCLYAGISTDTGSFQYPTTRPSTYAVAGHLVRRGANLARICHEIYQSHSLSRVALLKRVYNRFRLKHLNQIAYFWLRKSDLTQTRATPDQTEGLIDHIRNIQPVIVACLFEEIQPRLTRVSLRSKNPAVNVGDIAAAFGGGGHPAAAGARVPGDPVSVESRVLGAVRRALIRAT